MSKAIKSKIYQMIESIEDENLLNQLMKDLTFYSTHKDITEALTTSQLEELDKAILEADNGETLSWDEFKDEMNEWRKK